MKIPSIHYLAVMLFVLGCEKTPTDNVAATPVQEVAAPKLELRDFIVTTKEQGGRIPTGVRYEGRGTLLSKDPPLKSGTAQVWLSVARSEDDAASPVQAFMRDGVGTVMTHGWRNYKSQFDKTIEPIQHSKWGAIGYIPLQAAEVVSDTSQQQATEQKDHSQPVRLGLRDFVLTELKDDTLTTTHGRGTLVALDDRIKKGTYLVWLTAQRAQDNNPLWSMRILFRDGTATVLTHDAAKKSDVDYSNWKVIGLTPLQAGEFSDPNTVAKADNLPQSAAQTLTQFEVRDFELKKDKAYAGIAFYSGRGTIVAKNEEMKTGAYFVLAQSTNPYDGQEHWNTVLLKDGVGRVDVSFFQQDTGKHRNTKLTDWKILGYAALRSAEMVVQDSQ